MRMGPVQITKGVLQGDPLSSLLFSILLHDVIKFFKLNGNRNIDDKMDLLLYADDLTILSGDAVDMQDKLNTLGKYFRFKELEVNKYKSVIFVLRHC